MFTPNPVGLSAPAARFAAPGDGGLTAAMQAAYARDGFLVVEDMVAPADCDALMTRAEELVADFDPASVTSIFSTRGQGPGRRSEEHTYELQSPMSISYAVFWLKK